MRKMIDEDNKMQVFLGMIERLSIETLHGNGRIEIRLKLGERVLSSDFIDYSEVVRVVERENDTLFH